MFISKISASGNDFLVTHAFLEGDYSGIAKELCDRHYGVGADGFIVLTPSRVADIKWLFYNSDGSVASMCGNGTRAAAIYSVENCLANSVMTLESGAGIIELEVEGDIVSSRFSKNEIIKKGIVEFGLDWILIDTGVPHLVSLVDDIDGLTMHQFRELREKYNANINIGSIGQNSVLIRTYERGVEGETLACGTGMAALYCYLIETKQKSGRVDIVPRSGERLEFWSKEGNIFFKGRVRKLFDTIVQTKNEESV